MNTQQLPSGVSDILGKRFFEGGKEFIFAEADASLTAKTPYNVTYDENGKPLVKAIADGAHYNLVAIPERALVDGDTDRFQIYGAVEDMVVPSATYVAGRGLKIHDGAVAETGAAYALSDNEFAVITTGGTTVTAIDVFLLGREALGST